MRHSGYAALRPLCIGFLALVASFGAHAQSYSRTDTVAYADNYTSWVLGQVASSTNVDTGLVESSTDYDPASALPIRTYAFGEPQQTLTYNVDGTVATVKDGNNNVISLAGWKLGIPQSITFPATPEAPSGAVKSAVVDGAGWIDSVTDENGYKTCYTYDAMGRLATITYPSESQPGVCDTSTWARTTITMASGYPTAYGVPAGHWRQTILTGNGRKTLVFDALWRPLVEQTLDLGNVSNTTTEVIDRYDASGHLAFKSYPMNTFGQANYTDTTLKGTNTAYDSLDRATQVIQDSDIGPLVTTTAYLDGFQTRVTNARGYLTTTSYVTYDQPTTEWPASITMPEGVLVDIARDVFAKPLAVTRHNASNSSWLRRYFAYDGYQRLCKRTDVETGTSFMAYDNADNLIWSSASLPWSPGTACSADSAAAYASARRVDRTYDARNRLKTLTFSDGLGSQNWAYTPDGLPSQITTYNAASAGLPVVNSYTYNQRRLLVSESSSQTGWYTWPLSYGYDSNGHLASQTYPAGGLVVSYAPNALGQPTQAGTFATNVSYFPNGAIKQFTYGNGIVHTLTQNLMGQPDRSRDAYGSTAFLDDSYDYDQNGNVAAISDGLPNAPGNRTMAYDQLDRLTSTAAPVMFGATPASYTYDVLDNLRTVVAPGINGGPLRNYTYVYDSGNRLTNVTNTVGGASVIGLSYDIQGNLANKNGVVFDFDDGNRLRNVVNTESYRYDGYGRRVENNHPDGSAILSLYDQGGQLMYSSTWPTSQSTHEYIYLSGSLIAIQDHSWPGNAILATRYQHTDALGSPVAITDANRTVLERRQYDPFGAQLNGPLHDGPGYTGHVSDAATGLSYMQQRYYDPGIGRFLSIDPVSVASNTGDNFNRYWYANNNPYKFKDWDGRCTGSLFANPDGKCLNGQFTTLSLPTRSVGPIDSYSSAPKPMQVHTHMKSRHTDLIEYGRVSKSYPSRNDVSSRARPGAADPYESNDMYPIRGPYENNKKAFGPNDILRTDDVSRGRWLHGGGTGLPDPEAPRQGWMPTLGCTRLQNEDIRDLANQVREFKTQNPEETVPYERTND